MQADLVTDANAASRQVRIAVFDGTVEAGSYVAAATQIASTTRTYSWSVGIPEQVLRLNTFVTPLPTGLVLVGAGRGPSFEIQLRSVVNNIQVGDQWGNVQGLVNERLNVALL